MYPEGKEKLTQWVKNSHGFHFCVLCNKNSQTNTKTRKKEITKKNHGVRLDWNAGALKQRLRIV